MRNFAESALIALDAIWAAKLRSFMTVLGNIVAVTSIIAVVSLIQGLNASVKQAILNQAGADSFNIQQFPITRSDEEFDKVRNNPRITVNDVRAVKRYSELAPAAMLDSGGGVSARRGALLGRSQDEFAVIPLGQFQMLFGSRRRLSMTVKPTDVSLMKAAIDEATVALRGARHLKPKQPDNFGIFTSDTILDI